MQHNTRSRNPFVRRLARCAWSAPVLTLALAGCGADVEAELAGATLADELTASTKLPVSSVLASAQDSNVAANAVDGSLSTRWSGYGDGVWIQFDLGSSKEISLLKLAWYQGNARVARFDVMVGATTASLVPVASASSAGNTLALEPLAIPATVGRYVRILGHGNSVNLWNSMTEAEIWGTTTATAPGLDGGTVDSGTPVSTPGTAVFTQGFEGLAAGTRWLGMADTAVTDGCGVNGSKCLRVSYRPNSEGSPRIQADQPVPPAAEYTLNYDLFFETGWEFVKGGKLPGLSPKTHVTGCNTSIPEGWSLRPMWRKGGTAQAYFYEQVRSNSCGDGPVSSTAAFQVGRWHALSAHVRVNSTGTASDGLVELYVDGVKVSSQGNLRLRGVTSQDSLINNLFFSTFYGGSDSTWAPSKTTYARFDNFAVYPGLRVRSAPGQ